MNHIKILQRPWHSFIYFILLFLLENIFPSMTFSFIDFQFSFFVAVNFRNYFNCFSFISLIISFNTFLPTIRENGLSHCFYFTLFTLFFYYIKHITTNRQHQFDFRFKRHESDPYFISKLFLLFISKLFLLLI